jgi:hypothetical protein
MSTFAFQQYSSFYGNLISVSHNSFFKLCSKFTLAEDEQLRTLVESIGTNDWCEIAKRMVGRNARQCKERWMNYLSPTLNTAAWTRDEDFLLIQKYTEFGSRWTQIANFFPNRTDSMLKNRFKRLQRREQKRQELLLSGELTFIAPFLHTEVQNQTVTSISPSTTITTQTQTETETETEIENATEIETETTTSSLVELSDKEKSVAIETEANPNSDLMADCWSDSFYFPDEMYLF